MKQIKKSTEQMFDFALYFFYGVCYNRVKDRRQYLYIYPGCNEVYIEAYWEMWEDEDSYSVELSKNE